MTVKVARDVIEQPLKTTRTQEDELPPSQERNHEFVEWKEDYDWEEDDRIVFDIESSNSRSVLSTSRALVNRRFFVENLPGPSCQQEDEDDSLSLCSSSVSASFDDCSEVTSSRRVRFLEPLVSEVRYRPRTLQEDCSRLFYTSDETKQFRREYHQEKSQEACLPVEQEQPSKSYDISRVVVMANNSTIQYENNPWNSRSSLESSCLSGIRDGKSEEEIFFDNDSFWTGSITWY